MITNQSENWTDKTRERRRGNWLHPSGHLFWSGFALSNLVGLIVIAKNSAWTRTNHFFCCCWLVVHVSLSRREHRMGELILTHSARAAQNPRRLDTIRLFIIPVCLQVGSIYKFLHATPEKFENGVFTQKTHQMFSVHIYAGKISKRNNHRSF